MPSEILRVVGRHRKALLAREAGARADVAAAYRVALDAVDRQLEQVEALVEAARAAGEEPNGGWLARQWRWLLLRDQTEAAFIRFADETGRVVVAGRRATAAQAAQDAADLLLGRSPFAALPSGAIEQAVGTLRPGSPLRSLLDSFGPGAAGVFEEELVSGLALGKGPDPIAAAVRARLAVGRARAETIVRTELLRSYREASREAYRASGVVRRWQWLSGAGPRTCAACMAMHGTVYDTDTPMGAHPSCRCVMVPVVAGDPLPVPLGADLFAAMPEERQLAILGSRAKLDAYRSGEVELRDFVRTRRSPSWGTTRSAAGLATARENAAARERRAAA